MNALYFTNVYYDHIGPSEHPTFENYKECKKSLFRMADISVINSDDHYARDMISGIASENLLFFGCASEGSRTAPYYRAENIARWNEKGIYGMTFDCRDVRFYIRMPGTINVSNAMAAISVCESLGLSLVEISERLRNVTVRGSILRHMSRMEEPSLLTTPITERVLKVPLKYYELILPAGLLFFLARSGEEHS